MAISSDEEAPIQHLRTRRITKPSAHLADANNDATPELRSHQTALAATIVVANTATTPSVQITADAATGITDPANLSVGKQLMKPYDARLTKTGQGPPPGDLAATHATTKKHAAVHTMVSSDSNCSDADISIARSAHSKQKVKRLHRAADAASHATTPPTSRSPSGHSSPSMMNVDGEDDDDDIQIQDINIKKRREEKTQDVVAFFSAVRSSTSAGKVRRVRDCHPCRKAKHPCELVADASTCRRHLASKHKALYYKWCQENGFESMLAEDSQNRRKAAISTNLKQSALDTHLREPTAETTKPYYTLIGAC
ncbi:hypothetical protein L210DRAFT_3639332 [Boletus edulis BED1]|uniref:Uncharacterized protein n=1 Tax=Boletus edulis BED1 TaxID=1328754 RepID=A0AAD4CAU2_BOLED|nr:hypothetical protein L210DRAFT_3639332 [Boletus edulis BED1]